MRAGDAFAKTGPDSYTLAPEQGRDGYDRLLQDIVASGRTPRRIAHFWAVTRGEMFRPGSSFFHRNQEQGFYALMFLAQAISAEDLPTPLHITVVSSGAQTVAERTAAHTDKSTLAGPVSVIPAELPGVTVSWLDISEPRAERSGWFGAAHPTEDVANPLLEELLSAPANEIAALSAGIRYRLDLVKQDMAAPQMPWSPGDKPVVLITGGFGGIGRTLAADLIKTNGAQVILTSRSALDPNNPADPRARALAALGSTASYIQADVCNAADMQRVRSEIEDRFGKITGVIHAAGVIDDAPILSKGAGSVEAVFTPKIHGTQVLANVFPDGDLEWMVLFSSSSTVTAPAGQIDYVAANSYLNAFAEARRGGQTQVVALGWGIWSEVGMAADAMAARKGEAPLAPPNAVDQPLLDTVQYDAQGRAVFETNLSADRFWVLSEHRTKDDVIVMPGTGYLELAREALRALGITQGFAIRDLYFLRALDVGAEERRAMRVRLTLTDAGYDMEVLSAAQVSGKPAWQRHAQCSLNLAPLSDPQVLDLPAIEAGLSEPIFADPGETLVSPQEAHLNFGPRWRVLRAMATGQGKGLAQLILPDAAQSDIAAGYGLHPALMDLATGWAMQLIDGYEARNLWVPLSYEEVRVFRDLPAEIGSAVTGFSQTGEGTVRFDVTLTTPTGETCVEVRGFTIKKMDTSAIGRAPAPLPNEVEFESQGDHQPLSAAEERLSHNISQGIRPDEGAQAFRRVMAMPDINRIVVSSLDLNALKAQASVDVERAQSGPGFERPELDSDYAAPETEIERTLAAMWQDLLGVGDVGIDDSFFDLGGHSLIAVRLFAQIKKSYRVDFPMSVLFEAPTIRKVSALIEAQIGPQDSDAGAQVAPPERRFTHVVQMHEGAAGSKQPFFLVAGMFGNVLNLRHLAHLLGADRPFYGLQARGLYGDQAPHRSIEEAARDYIAELRQVQPEGPYLLGGFSGGGITAYEMRRQLEEAGETVSLVVLLDTPLPVRRPLALVDRVYIQLSELKSGGLLYPLRWAIRRAKWEVAKRRQQPGVTGTEHQFHNAEIEAAFLDAVASYEVTGWAGNLHLFRPPLVGKWHVSGGKQVNSERAYVLHDNDWTQHAPHVQVTEVPGDHDSMVLEPNVRVLAAEMRRAIEAAEQVQKPQAPDSLAAE